MGDESRPTCYTKMCQCCRIRGNVDTQAASKGDCIPCQHFRRKNLGCSYLTNLMWPIWHALPGVRDFHGRVSVPTQYGQQTRLTHVAAEAHQLCLHPESGAFCCAEKSSAALAPPGAANAASAGPPTTVPSGSSAVAGPAAAASAAATPLACGAASSDADTSPGAASGGGSGSTGTSTLGVSGVVGSSSIACDTTGLQTHTQRLFQPPGRQASKKSSPECPSRSRKIQAGDH
jgi:hypothetical protein